MWVIERPARPWEGFRGWLGLMNYGAGGQLPPLVVAAHGEGRGETGSGSVDLGMVWGCRRCGFGCGVLVGGMGGAGRRELPPRGGQNVKRL